MNNKLLSISQTAAQLGVSIDTLRRWDLSHRLPSTRSGIRGHRYYKESDIDLFTQNTRFLVSQWVKSSTGFEPDQGFYCQTRDVFQARLEKLESVLGRSLPASSVSLLTAVAGEIGNNSFDHNLGNWLDIPGIFYACDQNLRNIFLADRGQGILATLRRVKPELQNVSEALRVAFTQTLSGRQPETRGNGLKFVRSVIVDQPFTLAFQTGDAQLDLKQNGVHVVIQQADPWIRGCFAIIGY
ncbi:MAG: MerR family transcriptional regulator [Patescibacteria group bacterium]